jgi:hypothetical protein
MMTGKQGCSLPLLGFFDLPPSRTGFPVHIPAEYPTLVLSKSLWLAGSYCVAKHYDIMLFHCYSAHSTPIWRVIVSSIRTASL